ncbi:poly-gamma-glutamate hydrolase family protein [Streptomyces sp. NPDC012637]|uniref:poly-gamma-glutamate hydrolase family protein n=1 Tax=Streptomyces sp. NPDC012637 TaxID=3364842 RepID=UPI0036E1A470
MTNTSRRTVLASMAAVAAGLPTLNAVVGNGATPAAAAADTYSSNMELYTLKADREGIDWMRRFRIGGGAVTDNGRHASVPLNSTAVLAPHGGGIEAGTSELCMAVAGYKPFDYDIDPATAAEPDEPQRDFWMFEALASSSTQHVTSTHCNDPAAVAVCSSNLYAVSLHGFSSEEKKIIIGGRDERLKRNLYEAFTASGFASAMVVDVVIAAPGDPINGDDSRNIVNRTRTGAGAQLEISTPLREAMFGDFSTGASRRSTAGQTSAASPKADMYWNGFVKNVRRAIVNHEMGKDPFYIQKPEDPDPNLPV